MLVSDNDKDKGEESSVITEIVDEQIVELKNEYEEKGQINKPILDNHFL